jgi:predicted O-methyltransferase YrrM
MFNLKEVDGLADHPDGLEYFFNRIISKAEELPEEAIFVEIGNWRGGSAITMLQAISQSKKDRWLYTIDPYGTKPFKLADDIDPNGVYDEIIYRDAMVALSNYARKNSLNHTHWRMTSDDFMKIYEQVDFWYKGKKTKPLFGVIYIDGDHQSYQVNREMEWFMDRMVKGGLIIFDDVPYVDRNDQPYIKLALAEGQQDNFRCYYEKN